MIRCKNTVNIQEPINNYWKRETEEPRSFLLGRNRLVSLHSDYFLVDRFRSAFAGYFLSLTVGNFEKTEPATFRLHTIQPTWQIFLKLGTPRIFFDGLHKIFSGHILPTRIPTVTKTPPLNSAQPQRKANRRFK
jgi:hypothetical protein